MRCMKITVFKATPVLAPSVPCQKRFHVCYCYIRRIRIISRDRLLGRNLGEENKLTVHLDCEWPFHVILMIIHRVPYFRSKVTKNTTSLLFPLKGCDIRVFLAVAHRCDTRNACAHNIFRINHIFFCCSLFCKVTRVSQYMLSPSLRILFRGLHCNGILLVGLT